MYNFSKLVSKCMPWYQGLGIRILLNESFEFPLVVLSFQILFSMSYVSCFWILFFYLNWWVVLRFWLSLQLYFFVTVWCLFHPSYAFVVNLFLWQCVIGTCPGIMVHYVCCAVLLLNGGANYVNAIIMASIVLDTALCNLLCWCRLYWCWNAWHWVYGWADTCCWYATSIRLVDLTLESCCLPYLPRLVVAVVSCLEKLRMRMQVCMSLVTD